MRIAVVSHTYVTQMSQAKIQAMAAIGLDVLLLVPRAVKDTLREIHFSPLPHAKFKSIALDSYFAYHNALRMYRPGQLSQELGEFRPDVVLIEQEPYSVSTWQVARLKNRLGFKLGIFSFQNISKKYPFPFSFVERKNLEALDFFIAGCKSVADVWHGKGIAREKTYVLPQVGIEIEDFAPSDKAAAKENFHCVGKNVIGYAGRLVEEKGVQILLEAFAKAKFESDTSLLIVGKGPYKAALQALALELGIQSKINWIENTTHEAMPQALNAMDLLVLPSLTRPNWREQFGHVLIEAMACEVPCIGTDVDPINEVIAHAGAVFPEGNALALSNLLKKVLRDKKSLRELSKTARQRAADNFTNTHIAEELSKIFAQVIEKSV